ncbi:uncharacterized protein CEXT_68671 [Caerostris extrusa]|uniref:DAZ-associated protein 2 n=1 Tax=Caerostris extrusa TaxID=172846 RepID=A0AAV4UIF0_CAEEX|nr:uncharacterized protein CEXT_68671 [Caerostris extrusa]
MTTNSRQSAPAKGDLSPPHVAPYQPRATVMQPYTSDQTPYGSMAKPLWSTSNAFQAAAAPASYWAPSQPMFNHMPYSSPAASQHSNYFSNAPIPQPTVPRFPIKDMFQDCF